jgi:predicted PurR-regulated permease PerM
VNWGRLRDIGVAIVSFVILAGICLWLLSLIRTALLLVLVAVIVAYALEPILARLDRIMPRMLAAAFTYVIAALVLAGAALLLARPLTEQASALAAAMPSYFNGINTRLHALAAGYGIELPTRSQAQGEVLAALQHDFRDFLVRGLEAATRVIDAIINLVVVLVLSFWFMVDGRRLRHGLARLFPARHQAAVRMVEGAVSHVLGGYIRGQLVLAVIVGVLAGTGCAVLHMPYALLLGVLAFLFELVPMVGIVLAAIPAIVVALFQPMPVIFLVLLLFALIYLLESSVLAPRIHGAELGLHPALALVALLIGAEVGHIWGAILAVPIAAIAWVIVNSVRTSLNQEAAAAPER